MSLTNPLPDAAEVQRLMERVGRLTILTYHKIDPRHEFGINALSPRRFEQQMRCLASEGYQSVTFTDLLSERELPAKPIILTFDDAYESVFHNAAPVMEKYGLRGVAFVITEYIGKPNTWDVNLGGVHFPHMTVAQLETLVRNGWELGAHTCTHRALANLRPHSLRYEIVQSRDMLEDIMKFPPVSIAYPFGLHNEAVRSVAREAGFDFGCGSVSLAAFAPDLMSLARVPVYQFEGMKAFRDKLRRPAPPLTELLKLFCLAYPARLTPFYQRLFKPELFSRRIP